MPPNCSKPSAQENKNKTAILFVRACASACVCLSIRQCFLDECAFVSLGVWSDPGLVVGCVEVWCSAGKAEVTHSNVAKSA